MKIISNPSLKEHLLGLPSTPGVYQYKDSSGNIIYVGKAKNLKNRVRSYFSIKLDPNSKTAVLVSQIHTLVYIETTSELEALILEATLIKKHQPKYNIALKDDKSYLYVLIRPEKTEISGKLLNIPRVIAAREPDIKKGDLVFGPYPHGKKAMSVLRTLRRVIAFRDCSTGKFRKYNVQGVPCLYGHLRLCPAPCAEPSVIGTYQKDIRRLVKLLSGDSDSFLNSLKKEMLVNSKNKNYEDAAKYRDMLSRFEYLRQRHTTAQQYIDNPYLVEDIRERSLSDLVQAIPTLTEVPYRIECYDISNISGTDAVGSMVVALDGEVVSREYRKFKIKTKETPDDFAMMSEVLRRRLKRVEWEVPDLIVLDGGKGQVSSVVKVLNDLNMTIPLIGLAKKLETIVVFNEGEFEEVLLPRDNSGLKLLQQLRDEAHRFAQAYHHKLRLHQLKSIKTHEKNS